MVEYRKFRTFGRLDVMARDILVEAVYTPPEGSIGEPFTCRFQMGWHGHQDFLNYDASSSSTSRVVGWVCAQIKLKMKAAGYTHLPRILYQQISLVRVKAEVADTDG